MKKHDPFDFWYAVNNTEIILTPSHHLETFGNTILNYHLVSQLMDSVDQVRVREGRMQANQPQIITPEAYSKTFLEGFGSEANKYLDWLKNNEKDVRILQYGYKLKQEAFSEHIISGNMQMVVEQVRKDVQERNDPLSAVVIGVDQPWDVCLVKLFWKIIQNSAQTNVQELSKKNLFDLSGGSLKSVRDEIDDAFLAASKDNTLISALGKKLQDAGLFDEYQDRFFSLVKSSKRK